MGNLNLPARPSVWSVRGRLAFLYTLTSFGLLALSGFFLYWVLVSNLRREDVRSLFEKIQVVRVILRESPEVLEHEVKLESGPPSSKHYFRVMDEAGQTLMETPGMSDLAIEAASFPPPLSMRKRQGKGIMVKSRDHRVYLLMSAWANVGRSEGERRLLQAVLDISHEEAIIANYGRWLALVLFLGILVSAGAGVVVADSGMRPLREITQTVQRIRATQLNERINPSRWPTELRALAAAFDDMLLRLEDSFTRLSQFSTDLAHELRTPINNLMGEAEVTLSKARTLDEYQKVLESSLEEYSRLARMIDSLLFLARAEGTEVRIERAPVDARREIEAVREFYDALAEEKGITVACQGEASLEADPILFRRAVSNLLSNAIQYTPHGGNVTVSVAQHEDRSVEVNVSDTGGGIAPEHLPKIFDRFYRTDHARSYNPQGLGLGLAIVKTIMALHGGSVSVHSESGKGTTAALRFLPLAPASRLQMTKL
jgi:two-component system heavy metal sensor histidine kinase CusS